MELIDKDELKEKLISLIKFYNVRNNYGAITGVSSALSEIDDMKTTDGLVHAKWIKYENHIYDEYYYSCSACDNDWICIEGSPEDNNMNYCPYCGAKMDLKED